MRYFFYIYLGLLAVTSTANAEEWQPLLDKSLSKWEIWMGVPHSSVVGLPKGTYQSDNLNQHGETSVALGLNQDIKNVFNVIEEEGEPVLHISGEIYGGLTTKKEYEDYHLTLQFKWGDKKWPPRVNNKRDSGLLFHCYGAHGAFWRVWKACQELQIQETDIGDYIPLAGPSAEIRGEMRKGEFLAFQPKSDTYFNVKGYTHAAYEPDFEHGKWNTVELYSLGDKAVFVVNEYIVMVIENSIDGNKNPLTKGQLQLQSEGAELFYKDIKIKPLSAWPEFIVRQVKFK